MYSDFVGGGKPHPAGKVDGLSYKFQRLRERLRQAVLNGELSGKLPGERALAKRFHVNAKTLSKALTDLAAEGLLDRSIGRGTYVRGSGDPAANGPGRWLIVCDPERLGSTVIRLLLAAHPDVEVVTSVTQARPSFLKQFDAVIDNGAATPDAFLRDLVVRGVPVIKLNQELGVFAVNAVGADRALGASELGRDFVLGGHRRIVVVQTIPAGPVPRALAQAVERYAPDAMVRVCDEHAAAEAVRATGATAVAVDATFAGARVRRALEEAGLRVPDDVSLGLIGCRDDANASSGYFVDCGSLVEAVVGLLRGGTAGRPAAVWLAPKWTDHGTMRALPASPPEPAVVGEQAA